MRNRREEPWWLRARSALARFAGGSTSRPARFPAARRPRRTRSANARVFGVAPVPWPAGALSLQFALELFQATGMQGSRNRSSSSTAAARCAFGRVTVHRKPEVLVAVLTRCRRRADPFQKRPYRAPSLRCDPVYARRTFGPRWWPAAPLDPRHILGELGSRRRSDPEARKGTERILRRRELAVVGCRR